MSIESTRFKVLNRLKTKGSVHWLSSIVHRLSALAILYWCNTHKITIEPDSAIFHAVPRFPSHFISKRNISLTRLLWHALYYEERAQRAWILMLEKMLLGYLDIVARKVFVSLFWQIHWRERNRRPICKFNDLTIFYFDGSSAESDDHPDTRWLVRGLSLDQLHSIFISTLPPYLQDAPTYEQNLAEKSFQAAHDAIEDRIVARMTASQTDASSRLFQEF